MTDFLVNLSSVLAHSVVLEIKGAEPWGLAWVKAQGDDAPNNNEIAAASMRAYTRQLPKMTEVTIGQIPKIVQAQLDAARQVTPGYNELQTSQYESMAPRLATAASGADRIARTGQAETDASVLNGAGQDIVRGAVSADRLANPEFYQIRESIASMLPQLMSGSLSGGETEAISRSLLRDNARSGTLDTPSQISTVSNAMTYGDASRSRSMQGLGAANAFLGSSRAGFDPVTTVLGRPSASNGSGQFAGVQKAGNEAFGMGQSQMGNLYGANTATQQMQMQARDPLDRVNETMSSIPSVSD
jgi:hypothetical protein